MNSLHSRFLIFAASLLTLSATASNDVTERKREKQVAPAEIVTPTAFDRWFTDATLRLDYVFSGDAKKQFIALDELRRSEGWYGRRVNLNQVPLKGQGQVVMRDAETGETIYAISFGTLFQEWLLSEEATRVTKAFENVYQVPMPRKDVDITVTLNDTRQQPRVEFTHRVKVDDILIRPILGAQVADHRVLWQGGDSKEAIDVAIVAEGYTESEKDLFYADAQAACDELLRYEPFASMRNRFVVRAVALNSAQSGVSIPHKNEWRKTALSSSFDTFYSERYLTTLRLKQLNDALAGIPYEHLLILANTDEYGGGGVYNSYTLSAAHNKYFKPVTVHEFGHSFSGLADEYYYDDQYEQFYVPEIEPWEQNITTLADFGSKWADLLPQGTPVPTSSEGIDPKDMTQIGVYEGAGYQSKGVYRAFQDCRMKTNAVPDFCLVCRRAVERIIDFYTQEQH